MATTSGIDFCKNKTNKHFRVAITSIFFKGWTDLWQW